MISINSFYFDNFSFRAADIRSTDKSGESSKLVKVEEVSPTISSPEKSDSPISQESSPKTPVKITPIEQESPPSPNKENNTAAASTTLTSTPSKAANNRLNMSGTLLTSYTPSATTTKATTRSTSKTPYNSPVRSSAVKNILKESPYKTNNTKTPVSSLKRNKSMHLLDLVSPLVKKRTEVTSTPKSTMIQKTPKTNMMSVTTPLRKDNTLLKSAIKNSSIKKHFPSTLTKTTPKGKSLFAEQKNQSIQNTSASSSSVIEVENSTIEEIIDTSGYTVRENSVIGENNEIKDEEISFAELNQSDLPEKKSESSSQSSAEEIKNLLFSIASVLEENKESEEVTATTNDQNDETLDQDCNFTFLTESNTEAVIEKNFNKIINDQNIKIDETINTNIFENSVKDSAPELDNKFDQLVSGKNGNSNEPKVENDPQKKGEVMLKWIEDVRHSFLTEPNKTTQVIDTRYSDVTPNDSINDPNPAAANTSTATKYDARTPKLSILEAVIALRKSDVDICKLVKSPVSRLSVTNNSTEVMENYKINSNIPKSLRSTRKRIGNAIASLNDISQNADTTLDDMNESLNVTVDKIQAEQNQSQIEPSEILSLDNQAPAADNEADDKYEARESNHFIQFVNPEENKEIFEINHVSTSDDIEMIDSDQSESSEEESEIDEISDDDGEEANIESENQVSLKFRLSEHDLAEEGIKLLDTSKNEDDGFEIDTDETDVQKEKNDEVHVEIAETQDFELSNDGENIGTELNDEPPIQKESTEVQEQLNEKVNDEEVPFDSSQKSDDIEKAMEICHKSPRKEPDFEDIVISETQAKFDSFSEDVINCSQEYKSDDESLKQLSQENAENLDDVSSQESKSSLEPIGPSELALTELASTADKIPSCEDIHEHVEIPATQAFNFEDDDNENEDLFDSRVDDSTVEIQLKFSSSSQPTVRNADDDSVTSVTPIDTPLSSQEAKSHSNEAEENDDTFANSTMESQQTTETESTNEKSLSIPANESKLETSAHGNNSSLFSDTEFSRVELLSVINRMESEGKVFKET